MKLQRYVVIFSQKYHVYGFFLSVDYPCLWQLFIFNQQQGVRNNGRVLQIGRNTVCFVLKKRQK
jgi:hypothetical protein